MIIELISGHNQLVVYDNRVEIKRKSKSLGDKTIFLNQVAGIVLKEGAFLSPGYISFTVPGNNSTMMGRASAFNAVLDENTFVFQKKDTDLAKEIKVKIEALIANQPKSSNQPVSNNPDLIRKYKQLFDDGIITKEEYETKKKEILGI